MCRGPCPGKDGCVVTWGDAAAGGDSSTVQDQLHEVRQVENLGVASAVANAVIWFLHVSTVIKVLSPGQR